MDEKQQTQNQNQTQPLDNLDQNWQDMNQAWGKLLILGAVWASVDLSKAKAKADSKSDYSVETVVEQN